jgi:hypothetical protein
MMYLCDLVGSYKTEYYTNGNIYENPDFLGQTP